MERAKLLAVLVTALCITCTPAGAQQGAKTNAYLSLERTYHTDCIGFERPFLDGRFAYYSKGFLKDNFLSKLNVLTGECIKVANMPPVDVKPRAISDQYLFAEDGIYSRHSVYTLGDWNRHGSIRMHDGIYASAIFGDSLYLVQFDYDSPPRPNGSLFVSRFSLPDFKFRDLHPIQMKDFPGYGGLKVFVSGNTFVLFNHTGMLLYDYPTGKVREQKLPLGPYELLTDYKQRIACGQEVQPIEPELVFVRTGCHSFALFDLAHLAQRYTVELGEAFGAKAIRSGQLLYLVKELPVPPGSGSETYDIQVREFKSGKLLGTAQSLISESTTEVFHVEDHLIRSVFDSDALDFRIEVYKMRTHL